MPRGGKREGSGRKPRQDGRKSRVVKIPLTDAELETIKVQLKPDERRKILMRAIERKKENET